MTPAPARANRKDEILATFTAMVAERGYDEVSLRDMATRLGMSKGTILHHFGTKDRMLEQQHTGYMHRRLTEARGFLERLQTPSARLSAIVHQNMIAQRDDRDATVAFAREISRFSTEPQMEHVRQMRDEYTLIVEEIVAQGIADGTFASDDPTITTLQIHGMVNWTWTWFRPDGRWSAERVADSFVRTFLSGMQTRTDPIDDRELDQVSDVVHEVMAEVAATDPGPKAQVAGAS